MIRKLAVLAILLVLTSGINHAQNTNTDDNEQSSTNPDLTLFIEDGMMTLYVSHNEPTSVAGFQFRADQDGELTTFSPEIRFDILEFYDYVLNPGTCLVYRYDEALEQPDVCDVTQTEFARVGDGDRFWLDDTGVRQTVYILKNDDAHSHCAPLVSICPVYYSIGRPIIDLSVEPQAADWDEFPTRIEIHPAYNQRSAHGRINDIIVHPDDTFVISAHATGNMCIWSNDSFQAIPVSCIDDDITGHSAGITAIEVNPLASDFQFASVGQDGNARLWTLNNDNEIEEITDETGMNLNHGEPINDLSWNPDMNELAVVGAGRLTIWNFDTLAVQSILVSNYVEIDWRDDQYIAAVDTSGLVRIINTETEDAAVIDNYTVRVSGVDVLWNQSNNHLITLTDNGTVRIYTDLVFPPDCALCNSNFIAQNLENVAEASMSQDGSLIAIVANNAIHVLEAQYPYNLIDRYIAGETSGVIFTSVAWFSESSNQIVASDNNGAIYVWEIEPGTPDRLSEIDSWEISATPGEVLGLAWDPDGELIGVVDSNLNFSIFDTTGRLQGNSIAHKDRPLAIDWHPTNDIIVTGGCGPSIKIWEENALAREIINQRDSSFNCITDLDFDPTGQYLVSANQAGIINVWSWSDGREVTARDIDLTVTQIAWDNTGSRMAFVDDSGSFQIFSLDGNNLREILVRQPLAGTSMNSLAWSPDGNYIATASDAGWIAIWDTEDDNREADYALEGGFLLEGHDGPVVSLSWSSRNNWLVSAGLDGYVNVWDAITGERLAGIETGGTPMHLQWIPAASGIAVGDSNGNIRLYLFDYARRASQQ